MEALTLIILNKFKNLPPSIAESFTDSFTKKTNYLFIQQDKKLTSCKEFPPILSKPLIKETPLLYKKKKRAITGLKIIKKEKRDTSR